MRNRSRLVFRVWAVGMFFALVSARAMNMPHLDLDSLTFLSTDVVIADLSRTGGPAFSADFRVVATVRETIYGGLRPGATLDRLSEFLSFFSPLENSQHVILFLDRRPHKPYFLIPEASESPFAVVSSGMYLIDNYGHVHEYSQQSNPGPYVAQGYVLGARNPVANKETDLALPALAEVKERILASYKSTQAMHALLDKATVQDEPAMLTLLDARYKAAPSGYLMSDAIVQRIGKLFESFADPELLLRLFPFVQTADFPLHFIGPTPGAGVDSGRVKFLIRTLRDHTAESRLRTSAVQILASFSGFDPLAKTPGVLDLAHNPWLASFADEINSAALKVFVDDAEDSRVRATCIRLLRLDRAEVITDMREAYERTASGELRFAIEKSWLGISDELYLSLRPLGGPVSSIVSIKSEHDCVQAPEGKIAFVARFEDTRGYEARTRLRFIPGESVWSLEAKYFLLTDTSSGASVFRTQAEDLGGGGRDGSACTELDQYTQIPAGSYDLTLQVEWKGSVISQGYSLHLTVRETESGRRLYPE